MKPWMYAITHDNQSGKKRGLIVFLKLVRQISLTILASSPGLVLSTEAPENAALSPANNAVYAKSTLGLFDISSFDVYIDQEIIHLIASGKRSAQIKHASIRYTRSEDGGRRWKSPVTVNESLPAAMAGRGNDVQLAANGRHLVSLWQTEGQFPAMGPMVSAYSPDAGQTWKRGANPAVDNDGSQAHIDVVADRKGNFHAVWLADPKENGYQGLHYARSIDQGKQWSPPVTLDDSTCSCCWNTLALSPDDKLTVLYRNTAPRDMSLMQSPDAGLTWRHVSTVGDFQWKFEGCPHVGGALKYAGTDNIAQLHSIVWTGIEDKSGLYHLSSNDNDQTWSTPRKLGSMAMHGDIAARNRNDVAAIWNEMEPDGVSIFYTKSKDGGTTWSTPKRLTEARYSATQPKLVATKHGFLALWTEKDNQHSSGLAWYVFE
ncbi:MAG: exo-alpha-sialidase [Nitrosomonas sp.]|nr:MAG: exo-alpha-sialidase [Nitrosomonas sp.]